MIKWSPLAGNALTIYSLTVETIFCELKYAGCAAINMTPVRPVLYTFPQASCILGMETKDLRNFVERELRAVGLAPSGRHQKLSRLALLALDLVRSHAPNFSVAFRRLLLEQMAQNSRLHSLRKDGVVVSLKKHMDVVDAGMERLNAAIAAVQSAPDVLGGEPCFIGTRIPVYMVADIASKHGVDDALDTYPNLTPTQVELATVYAKAHPRQGRPKRTKVPGVGTKAARKRVTMATPNA
jgi:uncharacterized protein (DUF433 family)